MRRGKRSVSGSRGELSGELGRGRVIRRGFVGGGIASRVGLGSLAVGLDKAVDQFLFAAELRETTLLKLGLQIDHSELFPLDGHDFQEPKGK